MFFSETAISGFKLDFFFFKVPEIEDLEELRYTKLVKVVQDKSYEKVVRK